jgi:hypothetical protein
MTLVLRRKTGLGTIWLQIEHPNFNLQPFIRPNVEPRLERTHSAPAISASLATVFMLRAVPFFAAGILSFESPWPSG